MSRFEKSCTTVMFFSGAVILTCYAVIAVCATVVLLR